MINLLALLVTAAFANDTSMTLTSGGIVFQKQPQIKLLKEKLTVSKEEIRVEYEFFNDSEKAISTEVAFPFPEIDGERSGGQWADELYPIYKYLESNGQRSYSGNVARYFKDQTSHSPLLNFELKIDGGSRRYHYRYVAKSRAGKDITKTLESLNVPLSALYLNGWQEEGALESHPKWKAALKKAKLLDGKNRASWTNQVTYFWGDEFPAKKAHVVTHTYRPGAGSLWVKAPEKVSELEQIRIGDGYWKWKDYCPSEAITKNLLETYAAPRETEGGIAREPYPRAIEIAYILKTAANWGGPIANFEMEVIPSAPGAITTFCWPTPVAPREDGHIVVNETNFVPKTDLRVLMLEPKSHVFPKEGT